MIDFQYQNRSFSTVIMQPLMYKVRKYSYNAMGGPKEATILAYGEKNALFGLIELLRCPVTIYDEHKDPRWWGFIQSVNINWEGIEFGVNLRNMNNKIAVAYTTDNLRYTTAYSSDSDSTTEYGTKEMLLSSSEITEELALQMRDTALMQQKYPTATHRFTGISTRNYAEIQCVSWLNTLDWRYYENDAGKESYETIGSGGREIGEDDRPIFAQAFQLSSTSGWTASSVWLHCYKYPSSAPPVDNLVLSLKADNAGNPAVANLATSTKAAADIGTQAEWLEFVLTVPVALNTGTTYWLHIARSGAVSASAYYMVDTNRDNGYTLGAPKYYNTNLSTWVDASHKGDLNFIVSGDIETTTQISTMITDVGEFFTGTIIDDESNVDTNPFRYGDNTAYFELLKLLRIGTTNDRRLLCTARRDRYLQVYEEPAKPTVMSNAYKIDSLGHLFDPYGRLVSPSECLTGVWCALKDVIPDSVDLSKLSNPSPFFIEEAEYDAMENLYRILEVRDEEDVFDIGGVIQG